MKSLDLRNRVIDNDVNLDTVRLIIFQIGTFFFGAMIAAIQRSINEKGWFGFKKCSRIKQPKKKMNSLGTIAIEEQAYK